MKKLSLLFATLIVALLSFSSCSKEGPADVQPQEYKDAIKSAVYESAELIQSVDNKDLLGVIDQMAMIQNNRFKPMAAATRAFCETGNPMPLIQLAAATPFEQYYGNYTYDAQQQKWIRTDNKESIVFIYSYQNEEAVWKVTPSKQTLDCKILGQPLTLPKGFTASIAWNGKTLLAVNSTLDLTSDLQKGKISVAAESNGSKSSIQLDATPSLIRADFANSINGTEVLSATAKVNGKNMTDLQGLMIALMNGEYDKLLNIFVGAEAEVKFMDEIVVKGSCSNMLEVVKAAKAKTSKDYAEALEAALKSNVKLDLKYSGKSETVAEILFKAEKGNIQVYIHFLADDASFTLEEYFDQAFVQDLEKQFEGLLMETLQSIPNLIELIANLMK